MGYYNDVCVLCSEDTFEQVRIRAEKRFAEQAEQHPDWHLDKAWKPSDTLASADALAVAGGLTAYRFDCVKWSGTAELCITEAIEEMAEEEAGIEFIRVGEEEGDIEKIGEESDLPAHLETRTIINVYE